MSEKQTPNQHNKWVCQHPYFAALLAFLLVISLLFLFAYTKIGQFLTDLSQHWVSPIAIALIVIAYLLRSPLSSIIIAISDKIRGATEAGRTSSGDIYIRWWHERTDKQKPLTKAQPAKGREYYEVHEGAELNVFDYVCLLDFCASTTIAFLHGPPPDDMKIQMTDEAKLMVAKIKELQPDSPGLPRLLKWLENLNPNLS